jgi:uncharacterized YccA/Bax inhibitor family protein
MRTANPALGPGTFTAFPRVEGSSAVMTIQGTVNKSALLLFITALAAMWTWNLYSSGQSATVMPWLVAGGIGGFVMALVTVWKKEWAMITAPIYCALQGIVLGAISSIFEAAYPGIVIQAVGLTFGTTLSLLLAYRAGLIRATENFKLGVFAATGGIGLIYLASFLLGIFGIRIPYIHESGMIGIGFSAFVVVIAALNLVLDFDFIEVGSERGVPKHMEWYAAFGLMVTLIWLYLEMLRLLAKLRDRR